MDLEIFPKDEETFPPQELDALRKILGNSQEDWHTQHFQKIKHNLSDTLNFTNRFITHRLVAYFTNTPPYLQDFRDWVEDEFRGRQRWKISHTILWKNFCLIEFTKAKDKDATLDYAPWFYGRKYMYTLPWTPDFDVTIGHYNMLPVQIEIPFRSLVLERARYKLVSSRGGIAPCPKK